MNSFISYIDSFISIFVNSYLHSSILFILSSDFLYKFSLFRSSPPSTHLYSMRLFETCHPIFFPSTLFTDECMTGVHECDSKCLNVPGGYNCSCETGFLLANKTKCIGKDLRYILNSLVTQYVLSYLVGINPTKLDKSYPIIPVMK